MTVKSWQIDGWMDEFFYNWLRFKVVIAKVVGATFSGHSAEFGTGMIGTGMAWQTMVQIRPYV